MTSIITCYVMAAIWLAASLIKGDMHEVWAPGLIISNAWLVGACVVRELRK